MPTTINFDADNWLIGRQGVIERDANWRVYFFAHPTLFLSLLLLYKYCTSQTITIAPKTQMDEEAEAIASVIHNI